MNYAEFLYMDSLLLAMEQEFIDELEEKLTEE